MVGAFSMQENKIHHGRRPYEGFTLQERIEATMADSINNNIPTNAGCQRTYSIIYNSSQTDLL